MADDFEADAASLGLQPSPAVGTAPGDAPDADLVFYLWPQDWPVWCLWRSLETQWLVGGMAGPTGLDYSVVLALIARRFKRRERDAVFELVQAMEDAALEEFGLRAERQKT